MKKITVNGKDYTVKAIDFNAICQLEELGLGMSDLKSKSMNAVRALLAFHGEMTVEDAGNEIMAHIKNGGSFGDLTEKLIATLTESDFFQALPETDENTAEIPSEE